MSQDNNSNQEKKFIELDGFRHISQVVKQTNHKIHLYRTGQIRPLLTFSDKLNDRMEGLYPADQVVIAARLGVGKSALSNILLRSLKDRNPWAKLLFLYWSMEMPAYQQIVRLYSNEFATPVKGILNSRVPIEESMWQNVQRFGETLSGYNVYFREWPVSAEEWKNSVLAIQGMLPDCTIVNIFDHTRLIKKGNENSEEQRISELMAAGVFVKNKTDCINIFLSQMNRNIENPGNGNRSDIGSAAPVASD